MVLGRLTPAAAGFQPEDCDRHRLRAVAGGLPEERLGDLGGGLGRRSAAVPTPLMWWSASPGSTESGCGFTM
jgi:hypothetical protein